MADRTYDTASLDDRGAAGRLEPARRALPYLRNLAAALFIIAVPVAILTTNVRFLANEPRVYRYAIDQYGAVAETGIKREELLRASAELRGYFNNAQERIAIRVERGARQELLFNPRETDHLKDVKSRFRTVSRLQEFSLVYVLAYVAAAVIWAREVSTRRLAVYVAAGAAIALAVVGGLGAVGIAGFEGAWTDFHRLIFSNDYWLLNPATDHLIQMFPPAFWESIVFFLGLLAAAESALLLLAAGLYIGASGRSQAARQLEPFYAS